MVGTDLTSQDELIVEVLLALKSGAGQEVSTGILSVHEKFTAYESKNFCMKY